MCARVCVCVCVCVCNVCVCVCVCVCACVHMSIPQDVIRIHRYITSGVLGEGVDREGRR